MVPKKEINKNRIGFLTTLIITIAVMLIVYSMGFTVSVSTDESLEAAINEYNFTTDVEVDILATEEVGKHLFVLYSQVDHEGWGGVARLERGILGRYRFKNCDNTNWQLYGAKGVELGNSHYLLVYCLNDLPQVYNFTLEDENGNTLFQSEAYDGPFIDLIETETLLPGSNRSIHYFDEVGSEVSVEVLWEQFRVSDTGDGASVGSAEQGLIYVFLGVILVAGFWISLSIWKYGYKMKET